MSWQNTNEDSSRKFKELQTIIYQQSEELDELKLIANSLEIKLDMEKTNNEILKNQVTLLKEDIFNQNSKISDLKEKSYSNKKKINCLKEEISSLTIERESFIKTIEDMKEKEKIKSLTEINTDDQTFDQYSKFIQENNGEMLNDFFVAEEIGDIEGNEEGDLVYFITNPDFMYPKNVMLDMENRESIHILSPKYKEKKYFFNEDNGESKSEEIVKIEDYELSDKLKDFLEDKTGIFIEYKEPVKHYFIMVIDI
ncbi:hypothetical protein SteCoe_6922 [Stentor coeruleus]|uniref:Uncharacterized protein n=1 Tax=Stentor coeruleus TaxID=5963 RepID=A0A1R2CNT0_9CILI|nr:hypothetical protein SteCoe_6922 [Stentor coeruleus]